MILGSLLLATVILITLYALSPTTVSCAGAIATYDLSPQCNANFTTDVFPLMSVQIAPSAICEVVGNSVLQLPGRESLNDCARGVNSTAFPPLYYKDSCQQCQTVIDYDQGLRLATVLLAGVDILDDIVELCSRRQFGFLPRLVPVPAMGTAAALVAISAICMNDFTSTIQLVFSFPNRCNMQTPFDVQWGAGFNALIACLATTFAKMLYHQFALRHIRKYRRDRTAAALSSASTSVNHSGNSGQRP